MEFPTCRTLGSLAGPVLYPFRGTCRFRLVPRWLFCAANLLLLTSSIPLRRHLGRSFALFTARLPPDGTSSLKCHKFLDSHA